MKKYLNLFLLVSFLVINCTNIDNLHLNAKKKNSDSYFKSGSLFKKMSLGCLGLSNCFNLVDSSTDATPQRIGPPFEIADIRISQFGVDKISAFDDGNFIITYVGSLNPSSIFANIYSFDGMNTSLIKEINNLGIGIINAVTVLKNQNFSLATGTPMPNEINGNLFDNNGTVIPNSNFSVPNEVPRIIPLSDGGFALTSSPDDYNILNISIFDSFANKIDNFSFNFVSGLRIQTAYPSFVTLETKDNELAIVSDEEFGSSNSTRFLFGRLYNRQSNILGNRFIIFKIPENFVGQATNSASVDGVTLKNGNYITIWTGGSGITKVIAAILDQDNVLNSFTVANISFLETSSIGITNLTDDSFVIAYVRKKNATSNSQIFGKRYDSEGNLLADEFFIGANNVIPLTPISIGSINPSCFAVTWQEDTQIGEFLGQVLRVNITTPPPTLSPTLAPTMFTLNPTIRPTKEKLPKCIGQNGLYENYYNLDKKNPYIFNNHRSLENKDKERSKNVYRIITIFGVFIITSILAFLTALFCKLKSKNVGTKIFRPLANDEISC